MEIAIAMVSKCDRIIDSWTFVLFTFIAVLPSDGPRITGGRPRYHINDIVRVNCTSGRSKPATRLTWFINGEEVDAAFLKTYDTVITGREGLETTVLGLEFKVRANQFRKGDMKLKVSWYIRSHLTPNPLTLSPHKTSYIAWNSCLNIIFRY